MRHTGMTSRSDVAGPATEASVEAVFRQNYARLVRAAWLITGSRDVAEDLVQDVFANMLTGRHTASDLAPYIHRAVINRVRSWQRRQSLERRHSGSTQEVSEPPELHGLSWFFQLLSDRQRAAIVLRYYCDFSLADVAKTMGCTTGTVSVLIRRALAKARHNKEGFES